MRMGAVALAKDGAVSDQYRNDAPNRYRTGQDLASGIEGILVLVFLFRMSQPQCTISKRLNAGRLRCVFFNSGPSPGSRLRLRLTG